MFTSRSRRAAAAMVALTSFAWGEACTSYQRPVTMHPAANARIRLESGTPFHVRAVSPSELSTGAAPCRAILAEGVATGGNAGDTLGLVPLTRVSAATQGDRASCEALHGTPVVIWPDGPGAEPPRLTVRRFSPGRTTALVLVSAAVVLAVYAASQNEPLFRPGGECDDFFC